MKGIKMSGKIKYRFWDEVNRSYIKVVGLRLNEGEVRLLLVDKDGFEYYTLAKNGYVIERSTGFEDVNGIEIYEGDILTLSLPHEEIEPGDCEAVHFEDGCLCLGKDSRRTPVGSYLTNWRVVGNIHENPELLNPSESTSLDSRSQELKGGAK